MFKTVKDKIVTILNTKKGVGQPLQEVYGYMNPSPQNYPVAMVRVTGASSEVRLDTSSNVLAMQFVVRVLLREKNSQTAEDLRLDLMTALTDVFRTSANVDTMQGIVEKFDLSEIVPIDVNEDQPAFGFDLILIASKIKPIS